MGMLIDNGGVRQLKAVMDTISLDIWESVGPHFAMLPQLDNYQLGLHATRFRPWPAPVTLSTEVAGRWEKGEGVAFDHALLKADLTLFEDDPGRDQNFRSERFTSDFHLRLEVHGSYYNNPEAAGTAWGGGGLAEILSLGWGATEWHFAVGAAYNYYEDLITLPLPNALDLELLISMGL